MKKIDEKCSVVGHLVAIDWGQSPDKHTPYAQMTFRVDDGDYTSAIVRGKKHITEKTTEQVEEAFLAMGWDGETDWKLVPREKLAKKVILDIDIEEFESFDNAGVSRGMQRVAVVNFIKPLNGKVTNALDAEGVSEVFNAFQRFRALKASKDGGGGGGRAPRSYGNGSRSDDFGGPSGADDFPA